MPWFFHPTFPSAPGAPEWPGSRKSCAGAAWTCNPSTSRDAPPPAASAAGAGATIWNRARTSRTACRGAARMSATGSVCHLDVHAGGVDAMVVGSDISHVVVRIRKLRQAAWKAIRAECPGWVGSALELLRGRLSGHVLRVVTDPDRGLFPKPGEIDPSPYKVRRHCHLECREVAATEEVGEIGGRTDE